MKDIFGPTIPIEEKTNTWRAILAIIVFIFGLGIAALSWTNRISSLTEVSAFTALLSADNRGVVSGGDIIVEPPPQPKLPELVGEPPDLTDFSAISMMAKDADSGMVLFEHNGYSSHPIASLTKLMSALVILEKQPNWASSTTVVRDELIDTHMYAGDTYTLDELWRSAIIGSSNKAILTIADAVGWPRAAFVERMNQRAREIGMSHTTFVEQTGLEAGNVSTASDIMILLNEALSHTEIVNAMREKEITLFSRERKKEHHMWSTNWLLLGWIPHSFDDRFVGGKTGYIPESGYNFITRVFDENGHGIDVVVLGTESHEARFTEARDLAMWAMENYQWPE